jgi:hypothetical protein
MAVLKNYSESLDEWWNLTVWISHRIDGVEMICFEVKWNNSKLKLSFNKPVYKLMKLEHNWISTHPVSIVRNLGNWLVGYKTS